jgi:hypothetical protein
MRARLIKWLGGASRESIEEATRERDVARCQYADMLIRAKAIEDQMQFLRDQVVRLQDLILKEHGLIQDDVRSQTTNSLHSVSRAPVSWMRAKRAMEKADVDSMRKEDATS